MPLKRSGASFFSNTTLSSFSSSSIIDQTDPTISNYISRTENPSPLNTNAYVSFSDESGLNVKRSRYSDDSIDTIDSKVTVTENKLGYTSSNYPPEVGDIHLTTFDGNIECQDLKTQTVILQNGSELNSAESDVTLSVPGGTFNLNSSGLYIGSNVNGYTMPINRGLTGQVLMQTNSTGSVGFVTPTNELPATIAAGANYTLLSTNSTGGLAWTPVSFLRAYRGTETLPSPTGSQISFTANVSTDILQDVGLTTNIAGGSLSLSANGVLYSGSFARHFIASFSCDIVTSTNDNSVFAFRLENVNSPSIIYATSFVQLQKDVYRSVDLLGVSSLPVNNTISVRVTSTQTTTFRVYNPNLSVIMM